MNRFVFVDYSFDETGLAAFSYRYDDLEYTEKVQFMLDSQAYDRDVLDRALFLVFLLIGVSYYKAFPVSQVELGEHKIDEWQAEFLNLVYQEGLSQFAYENNLTRSDLAQFEMTGESGGPVDYDGRGIIALQSGGKDSLLLATMLKERQLDFSSLYISSSQAYPTVIDEIGVPVRLIGRQIDREALAEATERGGKNGHVPVTYIVLAIALIQTILDGKNTVLAAIGHEGEEPHAWIDDLPVNHQWSKTWQAEQSLADYIKRYIAPQIRVGSPLRQYSELAIARLFVDKAWQKYGWSFSSCNVANYSQGVDNSRLTWCGSCPKCANSYLLFAPFIDASELQAVFGGEDLFAQAALVDTFKGLLGVDGVIKPFECVGEVDELRSAYHQAQARGGFAALPFDVPPSNFDADTRYPSQDLLNDEMVK